MINRQKLVAIIGTFFVMSIFIGIGILFLVVFSFNDVITKFVGIMFIIFGLAFPSVNLLTGKNSFEYRQKKPIQKGEEKKIPKFDDKLVEAYEKDALAYTVKSKFNY